MSADAAGRPQPAYGEYATPEQVARARGMSLDEYEKHIASLAAPRTVEKPADAASAPASPAAAPRPAPAAAPARFGNRFATTALLAFGLACTLLSIPGLLNLGEGIQGAFATQGLDPYTSLPLADTLGLAAIVLQLLLWVLTLAISVSALRRGRVSWWIPLVAGVVAVIVVSVLGIAAMVVDPAFATYVSQMS